ncbi:hypothetical protein [Micromonospora violae]|uniref:hypothetical protein n=1 Tax=Micromonospora violae TaxID=1278207 RepID=UPI0033F014F1
MAAIVIGLIGWLKKPDLVLSYLKVLAWPLTLLCVTWWLREPIHAKLKDLLRLDVGVASMDFAQVRAEELSASVQSDLETLTEQPRERGEALEVVPVPPNRRAQSVSEDMEQTAAGDVSTSHESRELADRELESERRRATERLVKKVAKWGYDMGKNDTELPMPTIIWHSDGRPELLFSPVAHSSTAPQSRTFGDRERIRNLESEVRRLTEEYHKLNNSLNSAVKFGSAPAKKAELDEARGKLRQIYPESGVL